jgi:hypothetical protein
MVESLGGRSTAENRPVHGLSQGFREGGERGIMSIGEEGADMFASLPPIFH